MGTAHGKNVNNLSVFYDLFCLLGKSNGIYNIQKDVCFPASYKNTVTSFINGHNNISCIQVEINQKYRDLNNVHLFERLIVFFKEYVQAIALMSSEYQLFDAFEVEECSDIKPINKIEINHIDIADKQYYPGGFIDVLGLNGRREKGAVFENTDMAQGTVRVTHRLYANLCEDSSILLLRKRPYLNVRHLKPRIEEIEDQCVGLSKDLYWKYNSYNLIEIFNPVRNTHAAFYFKEYESHISKENTVWLSFVQRKLLDLELPIKLTCDNIKVLKTKLSDGDFEFVVSCYSKDGVSNVHMIKKMNDTDLVKLKKIYYATQNSILINPVEFAGNRVEQSFLLKSFIGKKEIQLRVVRGNEIEDSSEVIKVTKSNLKILGIEETDRVLVTYKGRSLRVRVLSIDEHEFQKTLRINNMDFEEDLDLIVCMPIRVRKRLGIDNLNQTVFLERDMKYLFTKNLYAQLVAVIGLFIAIFEMFPNHILHKTLLFCIITPVVIYAILSKERGKV